MKSESKIQQEICMWYKNTYCLEHHSPRCMIFSIPNEGAQGRIGNLKQTGMYSGVGDLCVVHFVKNIYMYDDRATKISDPKLIFIECKDAKGIQKPKQIKFEAHCKQMGIPYHIVRTLDDFKHVIENL